MLEVTYYDEETDEIHTAYFKDYRALYGWSKFRDVTILHVEA